MFQVVLLFIQYPSHLTSTELVLKAELAKTQANDIVVSINGLAQGYQTYGPRNDS